MTQHSFTPTLSIRELAIVKMVYRFIALSYQYHIPLHSILPLYVTIKFIVTTPIQNRSFPGIKELR